MRFSTRAQYMDLVSEKKMKWRVNVESAVNDKVGFCLGCSVRPTLLRIVHVKNNVPIYRVDVRLFP